ncbi:MAG: hypothetical protein H5T86_02930 [Armatimonadetes bacterium]|nr:hypothetical protein [Armatimonadota bacterium]
MPMRNIYLGKVHAIVALGACLAHPQLVRGQEILRAWIAAENSAATVYLSGRVWLRLIGPGSRQEARELVERLETAALSGPGASDVSVRSESPAAAEILVKDARILTVTADTARPHRSMPRTLAEKWADTLRGALERPYVWVVPGERLDVPLGESRDVRLAGPGAGKTEASVESEKVAVVERRATQRIAVAGVGRGDTVLRLRTPSDEDFIALRVRPLAAIIPERAEVVLTASPSENEWRRWSEYALHCAVKAVAGARVGISNIPQWPGGRVNISATGPDAFPVSRTLTLSASFKQAASIAPPDHVLVSNDPEKVVASRVLMRDNLSTGESVRVLWHHVNASPRPLWFGLRLYNLGPTPAEVFLSDSVAGPVTDELYAGHVACREYLLALRRGAGVVLQMTPRCRVEVAARRARRGAIVSGMASIALLSGSRVVVELAAHSDEPSTGSLALTRDDHLTKLTPFRFEGQITQQYEYSPPAPWLFIPLGKIPRRNHHGRLLHGNYGVLYRIDLTLRNPGAEPAELQLAMRPSGGAARAVLLVDDSLVETGVLLPGSEQVLASWNMPAAGEQRVRLSAIPQAGSNYPVHLIIRPAPARSR